MTKGTWVVTSCTEHDLSQQRKPGNREISAWFTTNKTQSQPLSAVNIRMWVRVDHKPSVLHDNHGKPSMTPWNLALWCQTQSTLHTNHKNSGESVTSQAQPWWLCKYGYPVTSLSHQGVSLNHKLRIYETFLWDAYIFEDETRPFQ